MALTSILLMAAVLGEPLVRWQPVRASVYGDLALPGSTPLAYRRLWWDRGAMRDCVRVREIRLYGSPDTTAATLDHYAAVFAGRGWEVSAGGGGLSAQTGEGVVITIQVVPSLDDLMADVEPENTDAHRSYFFVSVFSGWMGSCVLPR